MSPSMFPDMSAMGPEMEKVLIVGLIVILCVWIFLLLYSIVMWVLGAVGGYCIAKRRGIHHPGLAWIPIASNWLLGSISDQYQYVAKGRVHNRRKVLLGLSIPTFILSILNICLSVATLMSTAAGMDVSASVGMTLLGAVVSMILSVLSVVLLVFQYIAYYDLYASCSGKNGVLFLVLHIIFGIGPIFVFALRKKDEGMPPRKIVVPVAPWTQAPPPPAPQWQQPVQQAEELPMVLPQELEEPMDE